MTDLLQFLREVVSRCMIFSSGVTHIHMRPEGNRVVAVAPAVDRSVMFRALSSKDIPLEAPACLGNLQYLNQLLRSDLLGNTPSIDINTVESGPDSKLVVSSIRFQAKDRLDLSYMTTDPFRGAITKPSRLKIEDWPVAFEVTEEMINEVQELRKIHGSVPSAGKEDIMEMIFDGSNISVSFGKHSHTSMLTLDTQFDADDNSPVKIKLLSDQFVKLLGQIKHDGDIIGQISPHAVRFFTETPVAEHEAVMIGRTTREDEE